MGRSGRRLCIYALGHFWVDFSCALLMFSHLSGTGEWALCALLYNFCAFSLQMPVGLLADRTGRNGRTAALGCGLTALGWTLAAFPTAAAVTAGLGNACFHVGGGIQALNEKGERAAPLGVFVAPGALGICLGTALRNSFPGVAAAAGLLLLTWVFGRMDGQTRRVPLSSPDWKRVEALVCLFLVVVLRSYQGMAFPWKTGGWALGVVCAVVLGKAAGGFLGDRMGMTRAASLSLGLSTVCFFLSDHPLAGIAAIFLFNMTMPITLWAAARLLPGGKGFAFGTLTFALFLGFLPVWLGWPALPGGGAGYAAGALCSLGLLALGLRWGGL